jgi:translation initiation factor 2B subunit (eIF-2B alpha/beta/delta family)
MADDANALPAEIAGSIQAIRDDREHGASWLARAAARTLLHANEQSEGMPDSRRDAMLRAVVRALVAARPSMAAVANAAARVWSAGMVASGPTRWQAMHAMAERIASPDGQERQALIDHAEKLLAGSVYTLSRSGTVEDILLALGRRGAVTRLFVAESRPGGEGIALAQALATGRLPVTLVADAACGVFMAEVNCVVLGADSLRADGSVVNKVGSYPLAVMAHAEGKPVYVICETLKIAAPDFPFALEEMDPAELLPDGVVGIAARNPYFDMTPASLIASYITEKGILDRAAIAQYSQAAGSALASLSAS